VLTFAVVDKCSLIKKLDLIVLLSLQKSYRKLHKGELEGDWGMVQCVTSRMELSRLSRLGNVDILIDDNRSEHSIR
jgi:hypothetical protein